MLKIIFLFLRHGINPFSKVESKISKAAERFSDEEKQFCIGVCKCQVTKDFFTKKLYKAI